MGNRRNHWRYGVVALILGLSSTAFAQVSPTFNNVHVKGTLTCQGNVVGCGGGGGGGLSSVFATTTVAGLGSCTSGLNNKTANVSDSLNTCQAGNALVGSGTNLCAVVCLDSAWAIVGTAAGGGGGGITPPAGQIGGSSGTPLLRWNPVSTITTSATASFGGWYDCNATSSTPVILSLPVSTGSGQSIGIRSVGTFNSCEVMPNGSQQILGFGGAQGLDTVSQSFVLVDDFAGNWNVYSNLTFPGATAGTYTNATITVNNVGQVTAANSGAAPLTNLSVAAPLSTTGGTTPTISLQNSGVAAGSYTAMNATVDAFGRVTSASSGGGGVTSVSASPPVTATAGPNVTVGLQNSGASAGSYTNANISVNAQGIVTSAANGTASGSGVIVITSAVPTNCGPGTLDPHAVTVANTTSVARITLTADACPVTLASPADVTKSSLLYVYISQDGSGGHGLVWTGPVVFYSTVGSTVNDQPWYAANSVTPFTFTWDPTTSSWYRTARPPPAGTNSGGYGVALGSRVEPGNLALFGQPPSLKMLPSQWNQTNGDNAGPPQGSNQYEYSSWAVTYVCNWDNPTDVTLFYRCSTAAGSSLGTTLGLQTYWTVGPFTIKPNACMPLSENLLVQSSTFTTNHSNGNNWTGDTCQANPNAQLRADVSFYQNQTSWAW